MSALSLSNSDQLGSTGGDAMTEAVYPAAGQRRIITFSVMMASLMVSLDMTIANVALPHMQGGLSASHEETTWILTSYIIAAAIFTPLTGWLADRFGQKRVMFLSIVGFSVTSLLCGVATTLEQMVFFRLLQGITGAAMVPISQAILLDINPPERHGPAMALWGMGALVGPIIGPALGGWLTDNFSWHWVFLINLPLGVVCGLGTLGFLPEHRSDRVQRLDWLGFAVLALAIGTFQLMLDRGQQLDWFSSTEICIEAALAMFFFFTFIVHTMTTDRPFVHLGLFTDRNFVIAIVLIFFLGVIIYSVLALLPTMLERLMGYPVMLIGLVTAPRGVGTMLAMALAGQLASKFDPRVMLLSGLTLCGISSYMMTKFSLVMDAWPVVISGFVQGMGAGLMFLTMSTLAFATIAKSYRNEAAAIFSLIRNLGAAVGIAVLQALTIRNASTVHSRLSEEVRPDNPVMSWQAPEIDFAIPSSLASIDAEITRQAWMVSYIDSFYVLLIGSFLAIPLLLFARPRQPQATDTSAVASLD